MSLLVKLESDLKDAMRAGETLKRDTLRMVLAGLKNKRIELGRDLEEPDVLSVLGSAVKSRQDSVEQYEKAERPELAEKENAEIAVIQEYLPRQLSEDETRSVVSAAIAELGLSSKNELGRVMKAVLAKHKGQVDGKAVQRIAAELLG